MADDQILPSSRSLGADPHTTCFGASATLVYPGEDYSDYGFIAVLGLVQRLEIDILPITWQATLGQLGRGGQGEINQALVNVQTSFAFKCFDYTSQSDTLRQTVQEIVVLSHPLVQDHPHIVKLLGICWDIPQDEQVWPVLVFEKTHLGDLYHFALSGKGKYLSLEDKLKICVDVGIAMRDMHLSNIIHGDIKPQNVLIFEYRPGTYTAKVADFGFSTHFRGEQDLVKIPESVPWNAPEHHHRYFYPQNAKAMDVYSFGMLCLWLLFGIGSSTTMPFPAETIVNDSRVLSFQVQQWPQKENLLLSWKNDRDDRLLKWVIWLVAEHGCFVTEIKDNLTQFFRRSLCFDHQTRITDWDHLLSLLAPARTLSNTKILGEVIIPGEENFQIAPSVWNLYQADFRLRAFITTQLEAIVSTSVTPIFTHISTNKAAEQLALCYMIRFGLSECEKGEKRVSIDSSQSGAIEDQVRLIKASELRLFGIGVLVDQLHDHGFLNFINFSQYYREKGLALRAIKVYRREIEDTKEIFGEDHWLNLMLRTSFAIFLREQGQWKEAEEVQVRVKEMSSRVFGEEHPDTLSSMGNLASMYRDQGRWGEAEKLGVLVVEMCLRALGEENPSTLTSMANLALTYMMQGRWKEAEELDVQVIEISLRVLGKEHPDTLACMSNLASIFKRQGRWKEAEELELQVIEISRRALGEEHPDILTSMANLAATYQYQKRWKEAEELGVQVIEISRRVLGEEHPNTLTGMANLASTYQDQKRWKEAEELGVQVIEIRKGVIGKEHPDTLTSIADLASIYGGQRRWKEAEKLNREVIEMSLRVLGEEHPDTLTCINNLAFTLMRQGRDGEAILLMKNCFQLRKKVLGPHHYHTEESLEVLNKWQMENIEIGLRETL